MSWRTVPASRICAGQSWTIQFSTPPRKFVESFWCTACLVRAADLHPAWRPGLKTALVEYMNDNDGTDGKGGRAASQKALAQIRAMPESGESGVPGEPQPMLLMHAPWRRDILAVYVRYLLLTVLEWHVRVQHDWAKVPILRGFKHKASFLKTRRCTTWAMLDSTSMYMLTTYVRGWQGESAMLLATLVVCVVCIDSWRGIRAVFNPAGVPRGLTALGGLSSPVAESTGVRR